MNAYRFGDDEKPARDANAPFAQAEWRSLLALEPWDTTFGSLDDALEERHRAAIDAKVERIASACTFILPHEL